MLRALPNLLRVQDFPVLGTMSRWSEPAMRLIGASVNRLPRFLREQIYIWSGWSEAIATKKLRIASTDQIAQWMADLYPRRKSPDLAIVSAYVASTQLVAALELQ